MGPISKSDQISLVEDPHGDAMQCLARAYPDLYQRANEANWLVSVLAHGTSDWEEAPISEKVDFLWELAQVGVPLAGILEDAFMRIHLETIVPEGDTPWNMSARGLWKLLEEARRQGKAKLVRAGGKGGRKRHSTVTRDMLWKDIEALGGICAFLRMNASSTGDAFVVDRIRVLDSAKRAGWNPEDLLACALEKLEEGYRDQPNKDWCREAGMTMGRLFEWSLRNRDRSSIN